MDAWVLLPIYLILGWLSGKLMNRWKTDRDDTFLPGFPFVGHAVGLGRWGVAYIQKCREKMGNIFTLSLAGQRMTFLFDAPLIDTFFKAPDSEITFRPAVEQFTQRVFQLPSKEFFPKHFSILTELRHLLVPGVMQDKAQRMTTRVMQLLPEVLPTGKKVDLCDAIKRMVFRSAVDTLFGEDFGSKAGYMGGKMEEQFFVFEEGFELAASPVPHFLQPKFSRARADLLGWFREHHGKGGFNGTVVGDLLDKSGLRPELHPNLLLALLWASQANTVAATFWAIAFLLLPGNEGYREEVAGQLGQELAAAKEQDPGALPAQQLATAATRLAMDRKSAASRVTAEALRLRVQSIDVRIAAKDLEFTCSAKPPPRPVPPPAEGQVADPSGLAGGPLALNEVAAALARLYHAATAGVGAEPGAAAGGAAAPADTAAAGSGPSGSSGSSGSARIVKIPKGRILAVCPFSSHHDADLYPEPERFNPDRQGLTLGDGTAVVPGVPGLAFGGGPYRCPGRFFAEMEIALLMQLVLHHRSIKLCPPPPPAPAPAAQPTLAAGSATTAAATATSGATTGAAAAPTAPRTLWGEACYIVYEVGMGFVETFAVLIKVMGGEFSKWSFGFFDNHIDGPLPSWVNSGDPQGLLPPCELRRLVGVKVPAMPCMVEVGPAGAAKQ